MSWSISIPQISSHNPIVNKVTKYILANLAQAIDLEDLAKTASVSSFYLCRLFKKELDITPMNWLWAQRTMISAYYLKEKTQYNVTDIAFFCGFSSSAHFSRYFKKIYKMSPTSYRSQCEFSLDLKNGILPLVLKNKGRVKFVDYLECL